MRLAQLDAVRAAAIGLVIVEHYGGKGLNAHLPLGMGSLGVGLFFCLSGYLITSILLKEFRANVTERGKVWRDFYMRRFLRLVPAYFAWIAILVAFRIEPVASSWPWHVSYLSNIWIAMGNPILDFWSLAVEEQFYLVWPFVIAFTPRRHLVPVILLSTLFLSLAFKAWMSAIGVSADAIQTLLPSNLSELGAGSLLAALSFRRGKPFDLSWYTPAVARYFGTLCLVALSVAVAFWYGSGTKGPFRYYLNDLFCALPMAWVVIHATLGFKGLAGRIFDNPVLQYIGRISYGIYLTHNFIPRILESQFGTMPRVVLGVASISLTLAVAAASWHFFEKPILKYKRFFKPKDSPEAPATVPSAFGPDAPTHAATARPPGA